MIARWRYFDILDFLLVVIELVVKVEIESIDLEKILKYLFFKEFGKWVKESRWLRLKLICYFYDRKTILLQTKAEMFVYFFDK